MPDAIWPAIVYGSLAAKIGGALIVLVIVQLARRRFDARKARTDLRIRLLSVSAPRPGPISIRGTWRDAGGARWIETGGERVDVRGAVSIIRGTRGRSGWSRRREPTFTLRDRAEVVAMGRMSKAGSGWLLESTGDTPIEVMAIKPATCPRALGPVLGLFVLALCAATAWGALLVVEYFFSTAIPGATVERWSEAMDAACTDQRRQDSASEIAIACRMKPDWRSPDGEGKASIQLNDGHLPSLLQFTATVPPDRAFPLARAVLSAYGISTELINRARPPGGSEEGKADADEFRSYRIAISIKGSEGNAKLAVTISAPKGR